MIYLCCISSILLKAYSEYCLLWKITLKSIHLFIISLWKKNIHTYLGQAFPYHLPVFVLVLPGSFVYSNSSSLCQKQSCSRSRHKIFFHTKNHLVEFGFLGSISNLSWRLGWQTGGFFLSFISIPKALYSVRLLLFSFNFSPSSYTTRMWKGSFRLEYNVHCSLEWVSWKTGVFWFRKHEKIMFWIKSILIWRNNYYIVQCTQSLYIY